jgi:hypothetical protein
VDAFAISLKTVGKLVVAIIKTRQLLP